VSYKGLKFGWFWPIT